MDYCVLGSSTFTAIHFIKDKLSEGKKVLAISRSDNKQLYKNLIGKVLVFTGGASQIDGLTTMTNNHYNYNSRIGTPKNIKFNNNEILDASHAVAAGLIQNEININNKNRSKYTFRDDKRNLEKKKNFSFLKQWVGDNFF